MSKFKVVLRKLHFIHSNIKQFLLMRIQEPDFETTYFAGGLGSQLLSYIEYENKRRIFPNQDLVDVSYFTSDEVIDDGSGYVQRIWRLDHYGISIEKMRGMKRGFKEKGMKKRKPSDEEHANYCVANKLLEVNSEILAKIPIRSSLTLRNQLFFPSQDISSYGVIHVRKGDFLQVASRVITINDIVRTLERIKDILPNVVLVFSDGQLSKLEREQVRDAVGDDKYQSFRFFDSSSPPCDEVVIHDLMRCAAFLVTSNSTFSYTAGLLNVTENSKVIFPVYFYNEPSRNLNRIFTARATFALLD